MFENVKDAKVTIALGEESKYALDDEAKQDSSATAVVTMKDGGSPTEDQAAAIQRLVAKSVPGMELDQVAVFDGNGNDVSVSEESSSMNGSDAEAVSYTHLSLRKSAARFVSGWEIRWRSLQIGKVRSS